MTKEGSMTIRRPPARDLGTRAVRRTLYVAALLFTILLAGCCYLGSEKLPYARIALPYERTQLGTTLSLEVLNFGRDPAYQFPPTVADPVLETESDRAVGYSGRSVDGRKTWMDLIVFDEYRLTAARKYFFCIDERATRDPSRPGHCLFPPRRGILFDSVFGIDPEILTTPYATEEAQKIAILRWFATQFRSDMTLLVGRPRHPTQGNEQIMLSGLMVGQIFQGLFVQLTESPSLAQDLGTEQGIAFPHASLGTGRVRLTVQRDTGLLTIRVNFPLPPPPPP
jgi:hypothetical protein